VSISRLADAPSVQVRAWDSSFNTQPGDISYNILGMMVRPFVCFSLCSHMGYDKTAEMPTSRLVSSRLGKQNNSRYTVMIQPARFRDGKPGILFAHPMPPHEIHIDKSFGRPPWYVGELDKRCCLLD
jgi:hypothetical protein